VKIEKVSYLETCKKGPIAGGRQREGVGENSTAPSIHSRKKGEECHRKHKSPSGWGESNRRLAVACSVRGSRKRGCPQSNSRKFWARLGGSLAQKDEKEIREGLRPRKLGKYAFGEGSQKKQKTKKKEKKTKKNQTKKKKKNTKKKKKHNNQKKRKKKNPGLRAINFIQIVTYLEVVRDRADSTWQELEIGARLIGSEKRQAR